MKKKTPAKEKQTQGFAPRPRERRAAVHSLLFSVGSSAHSPVNSLRSNSTDSCGLRSKPFPRSSQTASTTAARLLETCSTGFIKSLALPFLRMSSSVIFVFYGFRKAVNLCITRRRIISDHTRLHYMSAAVFLRATKLSPTVFRRQLPANRTDKGRFYASRTSRKAPPI